MNKMTTREFNNKYKKYIGKGFYGLEFENFEVIKFLDKYFEEVLTKINGFKFYQVKLKFGDPRFYTNLNKLFNYQVAKEMERYVEEEIYNIINNVKNI